ncbi:acetate kinase [Rhodopirellula maiorica SM1]|uniref:Acetate kinase n=1 Tax=Rhodopirellula maiorica SM1 TaxID=1265738 RepID=M5RYI1_9BACT|nr:acetate kinase [Rhodopirellula maiorica]EMI18989.1 acetate kinase [Rhodopirellula maiorica SM1]
MSILCFNPGSGTLRYRLFDPRNGCRDIGGGMVDRIKGADAVRQAAENVLDERDPERLEAVGVRVVHGGDEFIEPTRVDDQTIEKLSQITHLAPLHLPTAIAVLQSVKQRIGCPVYAVFDTHFHRTMPEPQRYFALPDGLRQKYRRYGFHGIAHQYVSQSFHHSPASVEHDGATDRVISLHFGGGASACAVHRGKSVATTMGMTPLDGLMMSSRCGSLDPAIVFQLLREGRDVDEVERLLNQDSGLKGVSGISSDTRDILPALQSGDPNATLAIEMYAARVRESIGASIATLGGCDAVLISGALVKDSPQFRKHLLDQLDCFNIHLDPQANDRSDELTIPTRLNRDGVTLAFIPAREELQMARLLIQHGHFEGLGA